MTMRWRRDVGGDDGGAEVRVVMLWRGVVDDAMAGQ
jgi:hypothetical protein